MLISAHNVLVENAGRPELNPGVGGHKKSSSRVRLVANGPKIRRLSAHIGSMFPFI